LSQIPFASQNTEEVAVSDALRKVTKPRRSRNDEQQHSASEQNRVSAAVTNGINLTMSEYRLQ
jgi:hypothetical protein